MLEQTDCPIPEGLCELVTTMFDALKDPTRLQIIYILLRGEKSVSEIQEHLTVSPSAVSHQLRLLRDRRLVSSHRKGQKVLYRLCDEHVASLIEIAMVHARESL